jgi:hypothetical protein
MMLTLSYGMAQPKAIATKEINELKNGYLLIRLSTRSKTIEDLQRIGKNRAAEEIKKEQDEKNRKIIKAFATNFKFCEYRFFYSQYSDDIKKGNYQFLVFDKNMQPDNNFSLDGKKYYVAEFGILQSDTGVVAHDYSLEVKDDFDVQTKTNNYAKPNNHIYALIIKDKNYNQLRFPFPYYSYAVSTEKMVRKMNAKLINFYSLKSKTAK